MDLLPGILLRRRMTVPLHDLPPHILRDIGIDPTRRPLVPARGDKA